MVIAYQDQALACGEPTEEAHVGRTPPLYESMSRGRIVRWMLEEVGQPYRTEIVAFGPAMKGAT